MFSLFKRNPYRTTAVRLYDRMVNAARTPAFYADYDVPDTLDGRFECISLHVFALIFRLKNEQGDQAQAANRLAQALFDAMFRDMDYSLREMGVGDLGVPKRMKVMMKSFNGRCHAYATALISRGPVDLELALRRNLYGTIVGPQPEKVAAVATYLRACTAVLMATSFDDILAERFVLPSPASGEGAYEKAA